ncbi:MAG: site-specific DNA-methyltransferase [Bdellovibrionota bacterium]|nr:site-specific DNA-methyltransferase [Bdellovibrionota bacterium]
MDKTKNIEKLEGTSMNLLKDNIEKLKMLFPNIVREDKIDFDMLRTILGDEVDKEEENYQFTWKGKRESVKIAYSPSSATLRPCKEKSKNWDTTQNLYIEGDNLEVLKQLQKTYYGKIKMIYIDPPYNTGNDFVYKDDFKDSLKAYKEQTKQELKSNPETDGRYHRNWLNMMYPRLILARNLLSDDGVIFISIDDNELDNLKKICNEIFGEDNFINTVSIKSKSSSGASGGGEDIRLKKNIEFLLAYSATSDFNGFKLEYKIQQLDSYIDERLGDGRTFAYTNVLINPGERVFVKEIKGGNGNSIKLYKVVNYNVVSVAKVMKEEKLSRAEVYNKYIDKIYTLENAQTSIRSRVLEAVPNEDYVIAEYISSSGRNKGNVIQVGFMGKTKRLVSYLNVLCVNINGIIYKRDKVGTLWDDLSWSSISSEGDMPFNNGKKPIELIKRLLNMQSSTDSIILDFYSGSATTAHAVMKLNAEDGGNRKFILVQLPEIDNSDDEFKTICDLGEERIRRAGEKIKKEWEEKREKDGFLAQQGDFPVDIGFKVFKLDSTNIIPWDNTKEHDENSFVKEVDVFKVKDENGEIRTKEDILYEIMLKYGIFDESVKEININGKKMYQIAGSSTIISLEDEIDNKDISGICKLNPKSVIFKENGFKDDNAKLNAVHNLEKCGVEDIRVI